MTDPFRRRSARLVAGLAWLGGLGLCLPAQAQLRANFQLDLNVGGTTHSIRSSRTLTADQPISETLGDYQVHLRPQLDHDSRYLLTVELQAMAPAANAITSDWQRSYSGQLGGPLTFEARFAEIELSGALLLHRPPAAPDEPAASRD